MNMAEAINTFVERCDDKECMRHNFNTMRFHAEQPCYKVLNGVLALQQKIQNRYILKEIEGLQRLFEGKNIPIVFFKGLPLANEIYDCPENRLFDDIDAFVDSVDLQRSLVICKERGYRCQQMEDDLEYYIQRHLQDTEQHFQTLSREILENGKKRTIYLEIHTKAIAQAFHQSRTSYKCITRQILDFSRTQMLGSVEIQVPNYYHGMLMLAAHLAKHLFYDILSSITYTNFTPRYVSFKHLLDIGLYYEKYQEILEPNELNQLAVEWDLMPEWYFTLRILKIIHEKRFAAFDLQELYGKFNGRHGFVANAIRLLNDLDLADFLFLSSRQQAELLLSRCSNLVLKELISYPAGQPLQGPASQIVLNRSELDEEKHQFLFCRALDSDKDCVCTISSNWDNVYLYLDFEVVDDDFLYENKEPRENMPSGFDTIEMRFIGSDTEPEKPLARCFMINFRKMETEMGIYINELTGSLDNYTRLDENGYRYTLRLQEDGYFLHLGMKWELLDISPEMGGLAINFMVNDWDRKPPKYMTRLSWMEEMDYGFGRLVDITNMGWLSLVGNL